MISDKGYLDELNILKEDIQKLKRRRKGSCTEDIHEGKTVENSELTNDLLTNLDAEWDGVELEIKIHELSKDIENVICEIEKKAKDHPAITMFGAFVFGLAIGRLFLRK